CENEKSKTVYQVDQNEKVIADSSKQRLLKIIEGGWLNEKYIDAMKRLNSPMAAIGFGFPYQQIEFDISNLNGDTLINSKSGAFSHFGDRFDPVFYRKTDERVGMKIKMARAQSMEILLDYLFENNDTVLVMTIWDGKDISKDRFQRQFRKFPDTDDVSFNAMEYFANNQLLVGDWNMSGKTVSFSENGRVKNFRNFKRFSVKTFDENPESAPDRIYFYNDSTDATYTFTIVHQRLQLYEIKLSGERFTRGNLIAELSRN
ncbi:MAG TPA: hypothetical protein VFJ43_01280, partial [Bacteroidia bacterium]|nr:hypothetical protein [Bacteroidia bacterium]